MATLVRVIRAVRKAGAASWCWFMKYSGTTMIIDNIEERRRWRRRREESESGGSPADGSPGSDK